MSASSESVRRLTVGDIAKLHADGQRIAMLTAYDYPTAKLLDEAGIPLLLVGDSLGRAMLGYENEIPVSMADMSFPGAPSVGKNSFHSVPSNRTIPP